MVKRKIGFNFKQDLYFQVNVNVETVLKLLKENVKCGKTTYQDVYNYIDYALSKKCSFKNEYLIPHSTISKAMDAADNIFETFILDQLIKFTMIYTIGGGDWDQYAEPVNLSIANCDFAKMYPSASSTRPLSPSDFDGDLVAESTVVNSHREFQNLLTSPSDRTGSARELMNTNSLSTIADGANGRLDYSTTIRPYFGTRTLQFSSEYMYNRNFRVYGGSNTKYSFGSGNTRGGGAFVELTIDNIAKIFYGCIKDGINPYREFQYCIYANRLLIPLFRLDSIGIYRLTRPCEGSSDTILNRILYSMDANSSKEKSAKIPKALEDICKLADYCGELFKDKPMYIEPSMTKDTMSKLTNEDMAFNYRDMRGIMHNTATYTFAEDYSKGYELLGGCGYSVVLFDNISSKVDEASDRDKAKFALLNIIDNEKNISLGNMATYDIGLRNEQLFFTLVYNGYLDACIEDEKNIEYIKDNYMAIVYAIGHGDIYGGELFKPYNLNFEYVKELIEKLKIETGDEDFFKTFIKFYKFGDGNRTANCGIFYDVDSECLPTQGVDANLHNRTYYDCIDVMRCAREKAKESKDSKNTCETKLPGIQASYIYLKYSKEYEDLVDETEKLLTALFLDRFGRYPKVVRKLAKALVGQICMIDFYKRDEIIRYNETASKLIERINKYKDMLIHPESCNICFLDRIIRVVVKKFNKNSIKSIKSMLFGNEYVMLLAMLYDFSEFDLNKRMLLNFYIDTGEKYCALSESPIMKFIAKHGQKLSEDNLRLLLKNITLIKDCNSVKEAKRVIANKRAIEEKEKYEKRYNVEFPECNSITLKDAPITHNGLTMRMLDADDPRNFIVGIETDCCYHCDGAAEDSLFYSVTMPNSANVVIENARKDILATAWVWLTEILITKKYDESADAIPEPRTVQMLVFDNIEFANDADISKYIEIIKKYVEALPYDYINMGLGYNGIDTAYFYDFEDICKQEDGSIDFTEIGGIPAKWEGVEYKEDVEDIYTDYESGYKSGYVILKRDGKTYINTDPDFEKGNHNRFGSNSYSAGIINQTIRYNIEDTLIQDMVQRSTRTVDFPPVIRTVDNDDDLNLMRSV